MGIIPPEYVSAIELEIINWFESEGADESLMAFELSRKTETRNLKMFKNPYERYMTSGISETIYPKIALLLWNLIDRLKEKEIELDYLQVFELSIMKGKQMVIHRQEQPPYKEQLMIQWQSTKPITSTLWCIDNGEEQIIMFPEEY